MKDLTIKLSEEEIRRNWVG